MKSSAEYTISIDSIESGWLTARKQGRESVVIELYASGTVFKLYASGTVFIGNFSAWDWFDDVFSYGLTRGAWNDVRQARS